MNFNIIIYSIALTLSILGIITTDKTLFIFMLPPIVGALFLSIENLRLRKLIKSVSIDLIKLKKEVEDL